MKEKNLGNKNLNLEFVENTPSSYLQFFERTMGAMSRILVHPWGLLSQNFVVAARNLSKQEDRKVEFYALSREFKKGASQVKVNLTENEKEMDYVFLFHEDSEKLSLMMMEFLDMESGTLVAPITHSYYKNKSLFLISIPKSGTHLLLELVRSFGYHDGGEVFEKPTQGYWHYIENSNSHTSANNFFVDSVRRGNFGLRNHSFMLNPALFIYRNPLDILVSEANYYHKEGKSAFYSYLENLSFDERLLRLIDDPWLLGSIRDRVLGFIPWLSMKNVVPVSFEELVGSRGGGDDDLQTRLIWSLQLKLHVPGKPSKFAKSIFREDSPTFNQGQIGSYRRFVTGDAKKKFLSLSQDFMQEFGYSDETLFPNRIQEFRRKHLSVSVANFSNTPIIVESNFLNHNIIEFKNKYFAVVLGNNIDLKSISVTKLDVMISGPTIGAVKKAILKKELGLLEPHLQSPYNGFNIVLFEEKYYGLSQEIGPLDLEKVHPEDLAKYKKEFKCVVGDSMKETKLLVDKVVKKRKKSG